MTLGKLSKPREVVLRACPYSRSSFRGFNPARSQPALRLPYGEKSWFGSSAAEKRICTYEKEYSANGSASGASLKRFNWKMSIQLRALLRSGWQRQPTERSTLSVVPVERYSVIGTTGSMSGS